jgi:hypothetical protein
MVIPFLRKKGLFEGGPTEVCPFEVGFSEIGPLSSGVIVDPEGMKPKNFG